MGLDVTYARNLLKDIQVEHAYNSTILLRNTVFLPSDHKLGNDFSLITDDLCYAPGMVRFEYRGWSGQVKRVEGHVCKITQHSTSVSVKIWSEKHEMFELDLACVHEMNVILLEPNVEQ